MDTLSGIPRILSFGTIGLGFLLAYMTYGLLVSEQKRDETRKNMLYAIGSFMVFSIILIIFGFVSQIKVGSPQSSTPQPTPNAAATVTAAIAALPATPDATAAIATALAAQPATPNAKATVDAVVAALPPTPDVGTAIAAALTSLPTPTFTPTPTPSPTATPTPIVHWVEEGENLACIASKYFGREKFKVEICTFNRITIGDDCSIIQPGQRLVIPTDRIYPHLPPLRSPLGVRGTDYYCIDDEIPVSP